jgi:HNH endonuclease
MAPTFQESLAKLERLTPEKLDRTSRRIRGDLGSAEWKMGLCLLALKRNRAFRRLGYATLTDYAERVLNLSGRKTGLLIGAAEALEHLPLMSEAFRQGTICWGKVRAIHGLATPETERQWLEFAAAHRTGEVERKVSMCPRDWKRHQALEASIAGQPMVGPDEVEEVLETEASPAVETGNPGLERPEVVAQNREESGRSECSEEAPPVDARPKPPSLPAAPSAPKTIRLVFELTPDQYALYEQAESRVRAQEGRRVPRAEVLKVMADTMLSQGTARARARYQVLVHTSEDGGQAWYETERGVLPVGSEVLQETLAKGEIWRADSLEMKPTRVSPSEDAVDDPALDEKPMWVSAAEENVDGPMLDEKPTRVSTSERIVDGPAFEGKTMWDSAAEENVDGPMLDGKPTWVSPGGESVDEPPLEAREEVPDRTTPGSRKRTAIPNAILRKLFARSGHRCERCGAKGGRLDVHHRTPVSEGGGNALHELELLCRACHTLDHEKDLAEKPSWRAARMAATRTSGASSEPMPWRSSRTYQGPGSIHGNRFRGTARPRPEANSSP